MDLTMLMLSALTVLLALKSSSAYIAPTNSPLPPGYVHYENFHTTYKVHTETKTWSEANDACNAEGANLAIIDTYAKVRHIGTLKPWNSYVWVGVHRTWSGAAWINVQTKAEMTNIPWAPTKPAGSHNCLTVRGCNRGLSNEDCYQRKGFVCEIPHTNTVPGIMWV